MKKALLALVLIISSFTAFSQTTGDVNNDSMIDIVDALLVAQYYVGLNPPALTNINGADGNCDGMVDIVDALLIAQYYVGLIPELPCDTPDPTPIPTPSPTPVSTNPPTPAPTATPPSGGVDLRIEYMDGEGDTSNFNIYALFKLSNHGSSRIQLDEVTVRYFYTNEPGNASTQVHDIWTNSFEYIDNHRDLTSSQVFSTFHDYGPVPGADVYVEIGWTTHENNYLDPGEKAVMGNHRIHSDGWGNYDETDDFSYGGFSDYTEWYRMSVYHNGQLIYGVEPGDPPRADFAFTPALPLLGDTVSFDGSLSTDQNGNIASYSWDFGDGGTGNGITTTHTYSQGVEYQITLTVTDTDNLSHSKTKPVVMYTGAPVADFTWTPQNPNPDSVITFDGSPSFDVDGTVTGYSWNFGDGSTASGMAASHVYGADGGYTVTLTVTDNEGRTGSTSYLVKTRPIIGVIRWDAWVGNLASYGQEIEVTMSPNHWHYRLPFYGVELGPDLAQARCTTQAVVDQEIAYAKAGGIDYFAFLTYDEDMPLSLGIKLYLSSAYKTDVNFSVIMPQQNQIQDTSTWNGWITRFIGYLKEPSYQTVSGGRPLVYAFRWKTWGDAPSFLQQLESACSQEGIPEPYFVDLHWQPELSAGFDAMSGYAHNLGTQDGEHPYSDLTACAVSRWNARLSIKQVPLATSGWDGRPRIENPVSWIGENPSYYQDWYVNPTPQQLADHVRDAINFVSDNPDSCEARAILMYAWNEFDEGGWVCPTLHNGSARLDAIRAALDN